MPKSLPIEIKASDLMKKAQAGDALAYTQVLEVIAVLVRSFARGRRLRWGLQVDVEDIVQEVLMAVHQKRGTYDSAQPLEPWIFAIAHYKMVDFLRKQRWTSPLEDASKVAVVPSSFDDLEAKNTVQWGFLQLSEREREFLTAVKIDEKSIKQVAEEMNLSEAAVKVGVHRALGKLKIIFKGTADEK